MKRLLSLAIVSFMLLMNMTVLASAAPEKLPFELAAPTNVSARWLEEGDSPTTSALSYSLSNEMTTFFKQFDQAEDKEAFLKKYNVEDLYITTQVDWAVDDVNDPVSGWHYNEYWDAKDGFGFGYDTDGKIRVGEWDGVDMGIGNATETVNNHWVTRGVSEDALNGNPEEKRPGLKDQLKPEQYSYHDDNLYIDMNEHTMFYRIRFAVTTSKTVNDETKNEYYYSDWSQTASVGKGVEKSEPLTEKDLKAPVIADLHMTDKMFNDNPIVAFTLTVPEELAANATKVTAMGGSIYIETYCRVKGDTEWTEMGNTDREIKSGELECALLHLVNDERPVISKDTEIELRCRYVCSQPELDDIYSDYSEVITFGTTDIKTGDQSVSEDTSAESEVVSQAEKPTEQKDSCPICHFCPQPLGLCIFIWILIAVAVVVVIVVVIVIVKKKNKKENK